jgi:hypothetical protein
MRGEHIKGDGAGKSGIPVAFSRSDILEASDNMDIFLPEQIII